MSRFKSISALATAVVLLFATAAAADHPGDRLQVFRVDLDPVPHPAYSGPSTEGQAMLMLRGDQLTVRLQVRGASAGLVHAQHLHGIGMSTCPSRDLAGPDGFISTLDGVPAYGGVQASLTTSGGTGAADALAVQRFPAANEAATYSYSRTFTVPAGVASDLTAHHIVIHGIDLNGNGLYDFGAGPSSLTDSLPLEATIPAACGEIEAVGNH